MHLFDQAKRCPKNQDALKMIFAAQNRGRSYRFVLCFLSENATPLVAPLSL
jgi:hypothetical protein